MSKSSQLEALAIKRKRTRWPGYSQVSDFHGGAYESSYVSPYTKSGHNLDAQVFVLLQDWCSEEYLSGPLDAALIECGRSPSLPTNRNLEQLLDRHFVLTLAETYATNLLPFIKSGAMSARIPQRDFVAAARAFAIPQIQIVKPRLVICLGLQTFRAVQRALGHRVSPNLDVAISNSFTFESTAVWCQAHTGALGRANRNRGGVDRVAGDWSAMCASFRRAA